MKKTLITLALVALLPAAAQAQMYYDDYDWVDEYDEYVYVEDDYAPLTGDAELDSFLVSINVRFNEQPAYYAEQLAVSTTLQPTTLRSYLVERRYSPADVYMIGELAQLSGKSASQVASAYEANRGQGWGAVARSLGIKPGSPQFHELKRGNRALVSAAPARATVQEVHAGGRGPAASNRGHGHGKGHGKAKHPGKGNGHGKGKGKGNGKNK